MGNCACAQGQGDAKSGAAEATPMPHGSKPQAAAAGPDAPHGFAARYRAIKLLGRGAEADTWLFADRKRNLPIAIKLFARPVSKKLVASILREIRLQSLLGPGHMNLINIYEECAQGGPLTAHVSERWASPQPSGLILSEDEARYLFRQFIDAVAYCHQHSIAHRDLKLDNTLLDDQKPPVIKLCDFGFAKTFQGDAGGLDRASSRLGTAEYMGPELLHDDGTPSNGRYDPRATDVWAAGAALASSTCRKGRVMAVVMLLGAFPFDHARQHDGAVDDEALDLWLQEVNRGWSESPFVAGNVSALSPEARDLLDRIFVVDPARRITVPQIMRHPWYTKPLAPQYAAAADALAREQKALDAHMAGRRLDPARVAARDRALDELVNAATEPPEPGGAGGERAHMRPLHAVDTSGPAVRAVDLTETALAAPDNPVRAESPAVAQHTGL